MLDLSDPEQPQAADEYFTSEYDAGVLHSVAEVSISQDGSYWRHTGARMRQGGNPRYTFGVFPTRAGSWFRRGCREAQAGGRCRSGLRTVTRSTTGPTSRSLKCGRHLHGRSATSSGSADPCGPAHRLPIRGRTFLHPTLRLIYVPDGELLRRRKAAYRGRRSSGRCRLAARSDSSSSRIGSRNSA